MPPKKLKDLSTAPVYAMPHEQQVRLLSDALLREYMHRRGFLATLKAFDTENPRDGETISSRALMADLMALASHDQQRLKSEGIETIMEMLCDLRVEKRLAVEELTAESAEALPAAPTAEEVAALKEVVEAKRRARLAAANDDGKKSHKHKSKKAKKSKKEKEEKKRKSASKKHRRDDVVPNANADNTRTGEDGATLDALLGSSGSSSSSNSNGNENSDNDGADYGDISSQKRRGQGKHDDDGKTRLMEEKADALSWPGNRKYANEPNAKSSAISSGKKTSGGVFVGGTAEPTQENASASASESDEDEAKEHEENESGSVADGGSLLDAAEAESACRLLFGRAASMPPLSFLQQGFAFDDNDLEYALVQWRRGPGAVLAVVQSLVITYMYEKEVYMDVRAKQLDCLRRALSTILFRAQPDPSNIVIVNGRLNPKKPQKHFAEKLFSSSLPTAAATSTSFHAWRDFASVEAVEDLLAELLPDAGDDDNALQWLSVKGSGLFCFLLSVCLSRGVDAVARDIGPVTGGSDTDSSACLIDPSTGDGTKELLHLMLTGRATRKVQPRGVAAQPSGLLDGDGRSSSDFIDRDDAFSSCPPLSNPGYPSWVVHHRGHYSNLFMKKDTRKTFRQKKELSGSASTDLYYWDALTEEDECQLTIAVASLGQQGQRGGTASSFLCTAIQGVPDWAKAVVVDWHGETPPK